MKTRRHVLVGLLGNASLMAPSLAQAKTTAWDVPTPYTDGTFHTANIRWFGDQVAQATENAFRFQVHSNNSLIRLPEILRAVSTGQVPAGEIFLSQFGNEEALLEIDAIPFLTESTDQAMALYRASKSPLETYLLRRNVRMLYSVPWPSQAFVSKTGIESAADMRGVRFRTQSPMTSRMAELLGAVPTAVQGSDIPQAFATNIVTAMVTSGTTVVQSRAWEFSTYFINMRAFMPKNAVIVNERAWQRLPGPVQSAVEAQAALAERRGWQLSANAETEAVDVLRRNGMTVVQPSAALFADARSVGTRLAEEWAARAGPTGRQVIDAYRAASRT